MAGKDYIAYHFPSDRFAYAKPDSEHPAPNGTISAPSYPGCSELSSNSSNQWLTLSVIQSKLNSGTIMGNTSYSYDQLSELYTILCSRFGSNSQYRYRFAPVFGGSYGVCRNQEVLCNSSLAPFCATKQPESAAVNQNFEYNKVEINHQDNSVTNNVENLVEDLTQIIDIGDHTFNLSVDGSTQIGQYIDSLYYDDSTHTYTANTYDITYNNEFNRYETNYYTWNITYNISNTYVTYIGSNDAWEQEEYRFYYELPDGRSSADLTADEVAALSFQFADCINYHRSATDTNLRALYHFDGDTTDSGFFSDKTSFSWGSGASITYMDSSAFNGALYLDERAHSFDISLPASIYSGEDFTVQFRYYQASQPDTEDNKENSLSLGGRQFLLWDERYLYSYNGSDRNCTLPIGNWCELALIRHNGTTRCYVNGVSAFEVNLSGDLFLPGLLSFQFGDTSRAYSMLDELRVLNFALVKDGASYTPTSVPYDSNLVLVLPGESVVDSYLDVRSTGNLIEPCDFSNGDISCKPSYSLSSDSKGSWLYNSSLLSVSNLDSGLALTGLTDSLNVGTSIKSNVPGLAFPLWAKYGSSGSTWSNVSGFSRSPAGASYNKEHTFSVVDTDGNIYSWTFTPSSAVNTVLSQEFEWGSLVYTTNGSADNTMTGLFIVPKQGVTFNLAYAEFVRGATTLTAEKVNCVYDADTLKANTAAVHTDIPLHGYTVGGVRPTFPVRGDVWFQVTNGRVSGVQVYSGQAWTASNARYWTGERWIPIYAFDIFTLKDCWDVADTEDVVVQITSEGGFWNWWKSAWVDFRSWLSDTMTPAAPEEPEPSPSPSPDDPVDPDDPGYVLAPYVSVVRENMELWRPNSLTSLTVQMEPGNLWQNQNTARNLFTIDFSNWAAGDDLIASIDVTGLPIREDGQWDIVSFLLYGGDDDYISVGKKCHFDGFATVREVAGSGTEYHGSSAHNAVTSATLLFYKTGHNVRIFAKPASGEWTECDPLTFSNDSFQLGLVCWNYHERDTTVSFSNLRISSASRYALGDTPFSTLDSFLQSRAIPLLTSPITSESGFWNWWSEQWEQWLYGCNMAVDRIVEAIENIGSVSEDDGDDHQVPTYYKIDSVSELKPGDYLIYGCDDPANINAISSGFLSVTDKTETSLRAEDLRISNDRVRTENTTCVWSLDTVEGGYTLQNKSTGDYLYCPVGQAGALCCAQPLPTGGGVWIFADDSIGEGSITIQPLGSSSYLSFGFDSDNRLSFTCQDPLSGYSRRFYLYRLDDSSDSFSALSNLIIDLFDKLGGLVGEVLDWVLDLASDAVAGFGELGEYFKAQAAEISGFGGEFVPFLGEAFELIPNEIKVCVSLGLVLFALALFIRKVLLD